MLPGNEKAARYFKAVHPLYLKYLHGKGCGNTCICRREVGLRGHFKDTLYAKFQAEIAPIYEAIFGGVKEGSDAQPGSSPPP